jgi:hypothetical protein
MMMPRALFDQLGGWDESCFFYGEDIKASTACRWQPFPDKGQMGIDVVAGRYLD